jgi:hypothetical protein
LNNNINSFDNGHKIWRFEIQLKPLDGITVG